jgi:DNA-binding NtrC family response regulator
MARKILVVDDEVAVRKELRKFLEGRDYHVIEASSGNEALIAYQQHRPEVVLLDIWMPGKDGLETLKELKAYDPEASVIMVTALHKEDLARQAMDDGAFEYITKPIDRNYLELALMTKFALLCEDD